jgi:hypothetical protein
MTVPRLLALLLVALLALPAAAAASRTQEATFQDDILLVYGDEPTQAATLDRLRQLGADRLRVSVFWNVVETERGRYDFERYERLLRLARERGFTVNFNITGPAPAWATGTPPAERADLKPTWEPDPAQFEAFVAATGRAFPDVDYWSIWNEPNQAGWLTPQWTQVAGGRWVEAAPARYRALVASAWRALQATGHGRDTILIGETAPKGLKANRGPSRSIDVLRFLRRLYCLDERHRVLRGVRAAEQGCPGDAASFRRDNPALFSATGFAHHPYEPIFAPARRPTWRDWVTTGNLPVLSRFLRVARQRYGVRTPRNGVPLSLTEFGYQTKPPDPFGVSLAQQARYINEAEFIAYRNPAVRTMSQFLLVDDGPVGDNDFGKTYQTGLVALDGRDKPAARAYRLPVALDRTRVRRGSAVRVWGVVRPGGAQSERVRVEFRRRGTKTWRRLATRTVRPPRHVLDVRLKVPSTGAVRLAWGAERSRTVGITVVRPRR